MLQAIHIESMFAGGDITHWIAKLFKWNWHEWAITWAPEPEEDRKHIGVLELIHALRLGKYSVMQMKVRNGFQTWSIQICRKPMNQFPLPS